MPIGADVVVLKLITNAEIVGQCIANSDTHVILEYPAYVHYQQTQQGIQAGCSPFSLGIEDTTINFDADHILAKGSAVEGLKQIYDEFVTQYRAAKSGIEIPGKAISKGLKIVPSN